MGGQVAETLSCFGKMVMTQIMPWAVYFRRLWEVDTEEKDNSSLGCVNAVQSDHWEHTVNSTGWDCHSLQQRTAHTAGKHRVTCQRALERIWASASDYGGALRKRGSALDQTLSGAGVAFFILT